MKTTGGKGRWGIDHPQTEAWTPSWFLPRHPQPSPTVGEDSFIDWLVLLFPDADLLVAAAELDWVALPAPASVPVPFPLPLLALLPLLAPPPVALVAATVVLLPSPPSSLGEKP